MTDDSTLLADQVFQLNTFLRASYRVRIVCLIQRRGAEWRLDTVGPRTPSLSLMLERI